MQELIDSGEQEQYDLQQFLKNVRKYTDPEELTAEILNDLVDKIVVHAPDKSSGHRKQKIEIYYKTAGIINIADEGCVALDGRLDMQNAKKQPKSVKRRHSPSAAPPLYINTSLSHLGLRYLPRFFRYENFTNQKNPFHESERIHETNLKNASALFCYAKGNK